MTTEAGGASDTLYNTLSHERRRKPPIRKKFCQGFRHEHKPPFHLQRGLVPLNMVEEKEKFLKFGSTPNFRMKSDPQPLAEILHGKIGQIKFSLFHEAKRIMDKVVAKFNSLDEYVSTTYGPRITNEEASRILREYLVSHKLDKVINVIWCEELTASAQMTWIGPDIKFNKPEARSYTLLIKSSSENNFVRERGITCLADHEIGTHYIRSSNDGLQPWFSDRKKYNLCANRSYDVIKSEEGLAALNTILNANFKYLCMPALLYYNACMAEYLSFKQLFDHLERYVKDPEQRWKHCMRVKRGLKDTNDKGGYGKDQRYFEGATEILRHINEIDFNVLISGRICWHEIPRIRRVCRLSCIKLPHFMNDMQSYILQLRQIGIINGIRPIVPGEKSDISEAELNVTRAQLIEDLRRYDVVVSHKGTLRGLGTFTCGERIKSKGSSRKRSSPKRRLNLRVNKRQSPNVVKSIGDATVSPVNGSTQIHDLRSKSCAPIGDTTIQIELETFHPILKQK